MARDLVCGRASYRCRLRADDRMVSFDDRFGGPKPLSVVTAEPPKSYLPPPLVPDFKPTPGATVIPQVGINFSEAPLSATTLTRLPSPTGMTPAPTEAPSTAPMPITSHALTSEDYPDRSIRLAEPGVGAMKYFVWSDGTAGECADFHLARSSLNSTSTICPSIRHESPVTLKKVRLSAYDRVRTDQVGGRFYRIRTFVHFSSYRNLSRHYGIKRSPVLETDGALMSERRFSTESTHKLPLRAAPSDTRTLPQ